MCCVVCISGATSTSSSAPSRYLLPSSLPRLLARTFHKREANERLNDAILLYLSFHFFPFRSSSSCHLTRNAENESVCPFLIRRDKNELIANPLQTSFAVVVVVFE